MSTSLFEPRTQLNVVPVADRKQVQIFWQIDPLQQRERALLQLRVPLQRLACIAVAQAMRAVSPSTSPISSARSMPVRSLSSHSQRPEPRQSSLVCPRHRANKQTNVPKHCGQRSAALQRRLAARTSVTVCDTAALCCAARCSSRVWQARYMRSSKGRSGQTSSRQVRRIVACDLSCPAATVWLPSQRTLQRTLYAWRAFASMTT
jgi:hypothetical protein